MKQIKSINLENKKSVLNIFLSLTNICNFNCEYCCSFEKNIDTIDTEWVLKLLYLLSKLRKLNNRWVYKLIFLGWEPLLLNKIYDIFWAIWSLEIKNLMFLIVTNWYFIDKNFKKLEEFEKKYWKKIKLDFCITYHFDQYKKINWNDIFINWIKKIQKLKLPFEINFLLPKNTKLEIFLKVHDYIISSTNLQKKNINYNLIFEWDKTQNKCKTLDISNWYLNEMINFYKNTSTNTVGTIKNDSNLNIEFMDWSVENLKWDLATLIDILWKKSYNKFKWANCFPIANKNYMNLYVNPKIQIMLWWCNSLSKKHYSIEEFFKLLEKKEKFNLLCEDETCPCWDFLPINKLKC